MTLAYGESGAASRYDGARSLPEETKTLWLNVIKSSIPQPQNIERVLDLGCGTGRFTAALGETFACPVVGVEPSAAMLAIATAQDVANVYWKHGSGENIPFENESFDLVFMSQVFHHLLQPEQALGEIHRVLSHVGYLVIRNATRENNEELPWLQCFPEALELERMRMLSQQELERLVQSHPFKLLLHRTIYQLFAASPREHFAKVSQRGLSALIAISDTAFQNGLHRFEQWVSRQPDGLPVYEPVDLFIFCRQ
jgi:ubiquinone/menaquinone biosynthesis C-methylase UbiE